MKIFVCYHKKELVIENDILQPLQVGSALAKELFLPLTDNIGNEISALNPYYSELTAAYWIYKNVQEDIVGLCHYRRFFNFKNEETKIHRISSDFMQKFGYEKAHIESLMTDYDLILPTKKGAKKHPVSLYDFYKKEHYISDLDITLDVIKEKYPDQYQTAYKTLHRQTKGYYANMLIARKEIFDQAAAWLFDILFEVQKRIHKDVLKRTPYQQRVYGFISERLMSVFVALHPELRIKEMPCLMVETDEKKWRKYCLHKFKQKILNLFHIKKDKCA